MVRCQTNLGRVVDEFNADCEGDEVEIGFNNRYLLDALRNARTEKVRMEISGPLSPVKVLPAEGNDFCIWCCRCASRTIKRAKLCRKFSSIRNLSSWMPC